MQKFVRLSLALLLLIASSTFAPTAKATLCQDVFTDYFDCAVNEVGWDFVDCDANETSGGQQSGAFKEVETGRCSLPCGQHTDTWWRWNGSIWIQLSGAPSPNC